MKDPVLQRIYGLSGEAGGSPDGIGATAIRAAPRPGTGLEHMSYFTRSAIGQSDTLSLAGTIFRMVLMGAAGTVTGMAMAPSHDKRTKYAVTGGLLGFFLGPLGIGGQAVYVLSKE